MHVGNYFDFGIVDSYFIWSPKNQITQDKHFPINVKPEQLYQRNGRFLSDFLDFSFNFVESEKYEQICGKRNSYFSIL